MSTTSAISTEASADFQVGPVTSVGCGDQTVELHVYRTDGQVTFDISPPEEPVDIAFVEPLIEALVDLRDKAKAMWPKP